MRTGFFFQMLYNVYVKFRCILQIITERAAHIHKHRYFYIFVYVKAYEWRLTQKKNPDTNPSLAAIRELQLITVCQVSFD